jgi:hypothetical protein
MYHKIDTKIWGDAKFSALSERGKLLWFHLLTSPTSLWVPGLILGGPMHFAEALGWSVEAFHEAFAEVSAKGMAEADWKARLVWVPKLIEYNPPVSPNVVKAWFKSLSSAPECALKAQAIRRVRAYLQGMSEGFRKAMPEYMLNGDIKINRHVEFALDDSPSEFESEESTASRNEPQQPAAPGPAPDPELDDPEPDDPPTPPEPGDGSPKRNAGKPASVPPPEPPAPPPKKPKPRSEAANAAIDEVFAYWREKLMPRAKRDAKRLSRIRARIAEGYTAAELKLAVDGAMRDPWLMGEDRNARAGGWRDCETLFRDASQVDRLIALAEEPRSGPGGWQELKPVAKTRANGVDVLASAPPEALAAIQAVLGGTYGS